MTGRKSAKVHYVTSGETGYTSCGRYVTLTLQVTQDAGAVTCGTCQKKARPEQPTGAAFEALYAPGRRVRFDHPDYGYPADQEQAAALLTPGETYTIDWSDVGFTSTRISVAGVDSRGQGFNSVLFERSPTRTGTPTGCAPTTSRSPVRTLPGADTPDSLAAKLAEWRVIEQAADPGPWDPVTDDHGRGRLDHSVRSERAAYYVAETVLTRADAEFVATARTAMPLLIAAIEKVLDLHQSGCVTILGALCKRHENHRHFSITSIEADDVRACPDCVARVYVSCAGCGQHMSADACPVRLIITRELTGKEADHG
jgi:hypothetical protein